MSQAGSRAAVTTTTRSEAETAACGRDLAATVSAGTAVLLVGDLGAGKTAFVRGLAEGLGIDPREVTSPTFTLVQEYRCGRLPLAHIDLYRLDHPHEIEDLGIEDLEADHVVAIEWAEKLLRPPRRAVRVQIRQTGLNTRQITIEKLDEA